MAKHFKKFYLLLLLLIVGTLCTHGAAFADQSSVPGLNSIASKGLSHFLNRIPADRVADYGFNDVKELKKAALGTPYEVYTFSKDFLESGVVKAGESLVFAKEIRFPVMVDGGYRALLTVAKTAEGWKAVNFGAAVLAKELQSFEGVNSQMAGSAATKVLLRYYQGQSDFVLFKDSSKSLVESAIHPLTSGKSLMSGVAASATAFASSSLEGSFSLKEIQPFIRP